MPLRTCFQISAQRHIHLLDHCPPLGLGLRNRDVRVLAATNVRMESALLKGTFREDLYYRLSVLTIAVPPLRQRREEIQYLIPSESFEGVIACLGDNE